MRHEKPKTVVIGLGPTGFSCVRYLIKQGYPVAVTDSRDNPPALLALQRQYPEVPVVVGELSDQLISAAEQLVVSPGVSCRLPSIMAKQQQGVPVIGDVELFAQNNHRPVLAITGSNGKTTVTTLLGQMLTAAGKRAKVCGNIGYPVLDILASHILDYFVMELSSFQLETTYSLKPSVAVVLNVTPDHMDRYDDFSDYLAAKQAIYQDCDIAVINLDEPTIWQSLSFDDPPIGFTLKTPQAGQFGICEQAGRSYLAHGPTLLLPTDELVLQGQHHYQNALAALAMGSVIGLPMVAMLSVLKTFQGIAHRCQYVAEKKGVHWINDSKGTNVGATVAAIKTLARQPSGRLLLIAGGDAKQADLADLQPPIQQSVATVFVYGQDAHQLAAMLNDIVPYHQVDSLQAAVAQAAVIAQAGDTVLFSPACASFDMFSNYEHRGQVFIDCVQQLKG
jgi:UDP-N-acetylmuramoylalanine--D-glutamate ligase